MHTLKAIIFDMDGTLANTEDIHRQAFNAAFNEAKIALQWDRAEYKQLMSISGGRERLRQYLLKHYIKDDQTESVLKLAERLHKRKSAIYRQKLIDGHVGFRPGIRRLIDEAISNKIRLAIATSSSTKNVETLLKMALGDKALDLFSTIVTCDIVEEKKPSPAVYLYALDALGLDARNCIALEDSHNGNLAALTAGLRTVITTHLFTNDDDFSGAALVVNQLGEPASSATVISGNAYGHDYIDIALLDMILTHSHGVKTTAVTPG